MIPALSLIEDQIAMYNARRSGTEYNVNTLLQAIVDIGDSEIVLYIPKGLEDLQTTWEINAPITFPENITVFIPCGVVLNIAAGIQVVFDGQLINQCGIWHTGPGFVLLRYKTAVNTQSYNDFFNPFVVNGGLHGLSPTCFSPNFFTDAYVRNGIYLREESVSINYGALGANCQNDVVWVILSALDTPTIPSTNFKQVPGTHYYIDYDSSTKPVLPDDALFLMEVQLQNDQIVRVNDLRTLDAAQGLLERVPIRNWTPVLLPGTYTYAFSFGTWLRYGHVVHLSGNIRLSAVIDLGNAGLAIGGLPYENYIGNYGGFSFHQVSGVRPNAGFGAFTGIIRPNTTVIEVHELVAGNFGGQVYSTRILPNLDFYFTGTYMVNI